MNEWQRIYVMHPRRTEGGSGVVTGGGRGRETEDQCALLLLFVQVDRTDDGLTHRQGQLKREGTGNGFLETQRWDFHLRLQRGFLLQHGVGHVKDTVVVLAHHVTIVVKALDLTDNFLVVVNRLDRGHNQPGISHVK